MIYGTIRNNCPIEHLHRRKIKLLIPLCVDNTSPISITGWRGYYQGNMYWIDPSRLYDVETEGQEFNSNLKRRDRILNRLGISVSPEDVKFEGYVSFIKFMEINRDLCLNNKRFDSGFYENIYRMTIGDMSSMDIILNEKQ